MARNIGIDLGSAYTRLYLRGKGVILTEPTVLVVNEAEEELIAVGQEAADMAGKAPKELTVCYPVRAGSVVHCDEACAMLNTFFERAGNGMGNKSSVLAGVPSGLTEIERLAFEEVICDAGAKDVLLIDVALLAAAGAGIRITQPRGAMVIDIGAGTTEVAVMSMGGIVAAESIRTAGDTFDAELEAYLRRRFGVVVDGAMAKQLKETIGAVHPSAAEGEREICGRNAASGLPMPLTLHTADITSPLSETADAIAECARRVLEKTPPEMAADILQDGIALTGGGAQLAGLDSFLSERCHAPVFVAPSPAECTAAGLGRLLEYRGDLQHLFRFQNQ